MIEIEYEYYPNGDVEYEMQYKNEVLTKWIHYYEAWYADDWSDNR